jgi:hypothetical protein
MAEANDSKETAKALVIIGLYLALLLALLLFANYMRPHP